MAWRQARRGGARRSGCGETVGRVVVLLLAPPSPATPGTASRASPSKPAGRWCVVACQFSSSASTRMRDALPALWKASWKGGSAAVPSRRCHMRCSCVAGCALPGVAVAAAGPADSCAMSSSQRRVEREREAACASR